MLEERRWVAGASWSLDRVSFVQPHLLCYYMCKLFDTRTETEKYSLNLFLHKRKTKKLRYARVLKIWWKFFM